MPFQNALFGNAQISENPIKVNGTSAQPLLGTGIAYRSHVREFWVRLPRDINTGERSRHLAGSAAVTVPGKTAPVSSRDLEGRR